MRDKAIAVCVKTLQFAAAPDLAHAGRKPSPGFVTGPSAIFARILVTPAMRICSAEFTEV